jgi:hypothetical protein
MLPFAEKLRSAAEAYPKAAGASYRNAALGPRRPSAAA